MRRARGFTLLEVLVAIAIFATISAMSYFALDQALVARERVDLEREQLQQLTLFFLALEEDLAQSRPRTVRGVSGSTLPAFRGEPTDPRALAPPSLEFTRGGRVVFGEGPKSDLQRVGYRLAEGVLSRRTWPVLDAAPTTEHTDSELLAGVEEFRLRFRSGDGKWYDTWPPTGVAISNVQQALRDLPLGVEVTLRLRERGELVRVFLARDL